MCKTSSIRTWPLQGGGAWPGVCVYCTRAPPSVPRFGGLGPQLRELSNLLLA